MKWSCGKTYYVEVLLHSIDVVVAQILESWFQILNDTPDLTTLNCKPPHNDRKDIDCDMIVKIKVWYGSVLAGFD